MTTPAADSLTHFSVIKPTASPRLPRKRPEPSFALQDDAAHNARQPMVFVVDDDEAVRQSLCFLIESIGLGVRTFATADEFLKNYDPAWPGCLVLDLRLPGMSGLELQQALIQRSVRIPIIIVTAHGDVSAAVKSLKAGAIDFIEKPFPDHLLLERILAAVAHDTEDRKQFSLRDDLAARIATLTRREKEVMELVVAGKLNKQIAQFLDLSQKTVEAHRANLMVKMGAAHVADLVKLVVQTSVQL